MEIVLVSYGSTGDVRPLMALGLELDARGHDVRICAPPESREMFTTAGLSFSSLGGNVRLLMAARANQFIGRPLAAHAPMTRILRKELETQFRRLPAIVKGADLVVGAGLAMAIPSVAEALGIPYRYAVSIPALLPSGCHAPVTVPWQQLPAIYNRVLWWIAAALLDLGYKPLLNRQRHLLGLKPLDHVMPNLTANLIISADKELAPLPPETPPDCHQTGYWHPPSTGTLPTKLTTFLDRHPDVIYIGFGSMGDPSPHRTAALLRQAATLAGVPAVIQSGWAGWTFESDADCYCVVDELPHDKLFARVSGVVHHGGAGTVMTAARAGVPQVIVPHLLDQYFWGRRISQLKLGPRPLPINRLSAEALAKNIRQMVTSTAMHLHAKELAHPMRHRNGARDAARWITSGGHLN